MSHPVIGRKLSPSPFSPPLAARVTWATVAFGIVGVLGLARHLVPDPDGIGTHTQLGLPPCGFLVLTKIPCPGCGLTTSFAYLARFDVQQALGAQPVGLPLFAFCLMWLPLSLVGCARAWPVGPTCTQLRLLPTALLVALCALCVWVARVLSIMLA